MGFRFRQRIKIAPGFYLNLGKRGINSVSARAGWFTSNFNRDGVKHTIGAHGTGLSYETKRSTSYELRPMGKFLVVLIFLIILLFIIF